MLDKKCWTSKWCSVYISINQFNKKWFMVFLKWNFLCGNFYICLDLPGSKSRALTGCTWSRNIWSLLESAWSLGKVQVNICAYLDIYLPQRDKKYFFQRKTILIFCNTILKILWMLSGLNMSAPWLLEQYWTLSSCFSWQSFWA